MTEPNPDQASWPVLVEYGETEPGKDGCSVRVSLVQTPRGAHRVRLALRRDGHEVNHLDIGGPTASKLWPTLSAAAPTPKEGT